MTTENNKIPLNQRLNLNLGEFLSVESRVIKSNRRSKNESDKIIEDSFAFALSGGGIRAATICLGLMKEFNEIGFIEKSDYLSSVSGGGYLASYIQMARNKPKPTPYKDLFNDGVIKHLRKYRTHLHIAPKHKRFSNLVLLGVTIISFLLSWFWLILPFLVLTTFEMNAYEHYLILLISAVLPALLLSPNKTSLHSYYKNRLKKAYLWQHGSIKLKDLNNNNSPYPLINATVHVKKDDYDQTDAVTYRGNINTNYFLFSPLYCGSQVTHYAKNEDSAYKDISLATAMATSGAALSTFMGNVSTLAPIRWLIVLFNARIGLLAPSPLYRKSIPVLYPYYTFLEFTGKATTTSYKIQVSDGGHIENLGIYELLRRKVKTIIAIDSGEDSQFNFSDLRNLIIRAKNELGAVIEFQEGSSPLDDIMPSLITGTSKSHFAIAKISGIKGSYAQDYDGILVYIKPSNLSNNDFKVRTLKKEAEILKKKEFYEELELKRQELDYTMYSTYNPDFPHQTTTNQFFSSEQWDAYYELGKSMGKKIIEDIGFNRKDSRIDIFNKCRDFIK